MNNSKRFLILAAISILAILLLSSGTALSFGYQNNSTVSPRSSNSSNESKSYAFVSNFETMTLEGWHGVSDATPSIVSAPNYSGEPSMKTAARNGAAEIDVATKEIITGLPTISFQFAVKPVAGSSGYATYFGIATDSSRFVALIGASNGKIFAGDNLATLKPVSNIPKSTAYPAGWVYVVVNIFETKGVWNMQIFVDGTHRITDTVSIKNPEQYAGAMIETTDGFAYYSDIVVSNMQLGTIFSHWTNQDGYGQGGACLCMPLNVKLLPKFDVYSATMTLSSWSAPQQNILSFQINAGNLTSSTTPLTCVGFFQLGLDLNPNGNIAPWYVKGDNCIAHYYVGMKGMPTPRGSHLVLTIAIERNRIVFNIDDLTIGKTFESSIPYSGGAFDSLFTQAEFQHSNKFPVTEYKLYGSLYDNHIVTVSGKTIYMTSNYMLPFSVDAPRNWDMTYYQNSMFGYVEIIN